MKLSKNLLIGTLSGIAVFAGAGYYFYKRNQASITPLEKFKQQFRKNKVVDIIGIQQQFDYVYHLYVGQYLQVVSDISEEQQDDSKQKKKFCGQVIQQGYKCYDCIPDNQFGSDQIDFKEDFSGEIFLHTICEDCFDEQVHKGHRYTQLPFDYLTYCHCGISSMLKETSFCSDHCGYKNLKEDYIQNFPEDVKSRIIEFFSNLISYLIDNTTEQLNKVNSKKEDILAKFNLLLSIILNQILALIKENSIYSYCFQDWFLSKFNNPTLIDTCNYSSISYLKMKRADESKCVLDYLFMILPFFNDQSLTIFDNISQEIGNADQQFYGEISNKFLKYHKILLDIYLNEEKLPDENVLIRMSDFYTTCQNGLNNQKQRDKIILENQLEALGIVTMFKKLMKKFRFQEYQAAEWFLLLNFNKHLQSIMVFRSLSSKFEYIDAIISELIDMFCYFSDFYQLGKGEKVKYLDDFVERNEALFYLLMQQQLLLESFFSFFYKAIKANDSVLIDRMRKLISLRYEIEINRLFDVNYKYYLENKRFQYNLGIKIIYFILFILFLDDQPFTREGIYNVFKTNFSFKSDEEMYQFVKKIIYLLQFYIPSEITAFKGEATYVDLCNTMYSYQLPVWEGQSSYFWSPQFFNYELHIFTYQIVLLVTPKELSFCSSQLKALTDYEQKLLVLRMKTNFLFHQVVFDQSIYLNIVSDSKELLKSNESIEQNIGKAVQSTIIGILHQQDSQQMNLSTLMQQINEFIGEEKLINQQLEEIGIINKEKNQFTLKKQLPEIYNLFNHGRMMQTLETPYTKKQKQNIKYISQNRKFYLELFDFQKQLIIRECSNIDLFEQIKAFLTTEQEPFDLLYYTIEMLLLIQSTIDMSKELPNLFLKSQLEESKKIEDIFYGKEFMKKLLMLYYQCLLKVDLKEVQCEEIQIFFDSYKEIFNSKYANSELDS